MTDVITFFRGDYNAPSFTARQDSYSALGSLMTSDVQNVADWCLDLLGWVEDVRAGVLPQQSWQGNSWSARIAPDGLHLQDLYSDDWRGDYSLDLAHEVMLTYWNFLASSADDKFAAVTRWESEQGRQHPCRPHL